MKFPWLLSAFLLAACSGMSTAATEKNRAQPASQATGSPGTETVTGPHIPRTPSGKSQKKAVTLTPAERLRGFADAMIACDAFNISFALASGDGGLAEGSKKYSVSYLNAARHASSDQYIAERKPAIHKEVQSAFLARLTSGKFSLIDDWQRTLRNCNDMLEHQPGAPRS